MRTTPLFLFAVLALAMIPMQAEARWHKSYTYQAGYTYYNAHYVGSTYFEPAYYRYEPEPVTITYYAREYVPIAFSSYNPASVSTYSTQPLASVANLQAVPPPQQFQGALQVNSAQTVVRTGGAVQAVQPLPPPPATAEGAEVLALLRRMDARLTAVEVSVKGGAVQQPMPKAEDVPVKKQSALVKNCASCHTTATSSAKLPDGSMRGGGLVYFSGEGASAVPAFSTRQINSAVFQVLKGKMPKTPPGQSAAKLEDNEGQALLAELENLAPVPDKKE